MAEPLSRLDVQTRARWRQWLAKHHASSPGVWLVRHKRHSGTWEKRTRGSVALLAAGRKLGLK